jgi:hypothetical protein
MSTVTEWSHVTEKVFVARHQLAREQAKPSRELTLEAVPPKRHCVDAQRGEPRKSNFGQEAWKAHQQVKNEFILRTGTWEDTAFSRRHATTNTRERVQNLEQL